MSVVSRLAGMLRSLQGFPFAKYLDARFAAVEASIAGISADGTFDMSSPVVGKAVYGDSADHVALADADDAAKIPPIGIVAAVVSPSSALVRFCGIVEAAGSFTAWAPQYLSTTAGALSETAPNAPYTIPVAIAINTTDLLVLPIGPVFSFLRSAVAKFGSDIIGYSDPSSKTTAATVATAIDELQVEAHSALGVIELGSGASWFALTGDPLDIFADGTTTVPGLDFDTSKCACIRWNNDAAPAAITRTFHWPPDMDTSVNPVLHIRVAKVGATNNSGNTTTMAVELFNQVDAATISADTDYGGATSALVPNATTLTIQNLTRTITASDVAAHPASATITVKPTAGTLNTDDLLFVDAYIIYTRKPRTS